TDRLAEEGRNGAGAGLLERGVERVEGGLPSLIEAPRARRDVEMVRQVRAEGSVEAGAARERQRLHRRTVVGLGGRDHLPTLGFPALDVVAPRELDGHLDGVG